MAHICEVCGAMEQTEEREEEQDGSVISRDILHVCDTCRLDRLGHQHFVG